MPLEVLAPTFGLLAGLHLDFGPFSGKALVGPAVQVALTTVGRAQQTTAVPSVEVALVAGRKLGPGTVELEVSFLYGRLDNALAKLQAGGVFAGIGYRFDLFGGY